MKPWRPPTREEVERILENEMASLPDGDRVRFDSLRVTPRQVAVTNSPGEYVYVIAEYHGKVVYWSDIEEGWELQAVDVSGGISERGSNQFELKHIIFQLFGAAAGAASNNVPSNPRPEEVRK